MHYAVVNMMLLIILMFINYVLNSFVQILSTRSIF